MRGLIRATTPRLSDNFQRGRIFRLFQSSQMSWPDWLCCKLFGVPLYAPFHLSIDNCFTTLGWTPEGRRARGRPKTTWRRTVERERGKPGRKSWNLAKAVAHDRGVGRTMWRRWWWWWRWPITIAISNCKTHFQWTNLRLITNLCVFR